MDTAVNHQGYFPLSLSQLNIWNLEQALTGTSVNNISTTVRIRGKVDFAVLQQSINRVIESDASLRTQLTRVDGEVMQYHAPFLQEEFPVYDFSNTSLEGMESWENAVTRELIPLTGGPLYRFILFRDSENSGGVLVKLHHIISDGWSQVMLCNKISKTYLELLSGKEPSLEEAPDYQLHVQEEQDYLGSKAFFRDEKYWKRVVEDIGEPSSLKRISGASVSPVGRRMSFELPQIINHAIFSYCQKKRVAPFAVFYMALAIYFKRNSGAERFTIGVPIFNRTNYEFKQSTGMFVTTLPFHNALQDDWTLNSFNDALMENWYEMLRHQRYPFTKICELAGRDGRLFHIALSYQDSKIYESRDASVMFSGRWHYCGYQMEQLTIHLTNLKDHQQYAVDYDYLTQCFTESEIAALHRNLCHILSEALSEPDKPIHNLNVLTLEEKEQVLYTFNKTDRYLEEESVYDRMIKNSRKYLNRAAIIHNGERMTYGTLLHRSAQFASAISEQVEGKDPLVAIMLPRAFDLPAAMIGALQQNCAYLILSESLPEERIKQILRQSGASMVITNERGALRLRQCQIPVLTLDQVDEYYGLPMTDRTESNQPAGDQVAYVVYTSGSTGEPKGVEITQRSVLNLAQEMESVYGQGAVLSVCNVGFDAFVLESIVALLNGRTIVFPTDSDLESAESLASLINGYAVGFFAMTPSRLSALLASNAFRKVMWRMQSIVCGGEHFPAELLKKLKLCTHARIYNQYGPSEATVVASMKELSAADKITVGPPMGNCRMYVLDQWMNPLPIGGSGRLFIGGKGVGKGYRNRPDLTEKVFRSSPFVHQDGLYDTGDIAYWTPNGEIVIAGRADRQVKLRGLRIELQEISACIESVAGVVSAFARVCEINGNQVLGVYFAAQREISDTELIAHAATYLPEYMIPAFFVQMQALPITANGKINEAALPMPNLEQEERAGYVSAQAQTVLDIFKTVLRTEQIHANSDYFLSGGNSLNAMQCILLIEEKLARRIRVADLYAYRTAAKLAAYLTGEKLPVDAPQRNNELALQKKQKQARYPLTAVQQGMYVQSVLDPDGYAYHMPGAFRMEEKPDVAALEAAFATLIAQDAIFRTVFRQDAEGIAAFILDQVDFRLEMLEAEDFQAASRQFLRPFDLATAPLLRAALWTDRDGVWYLFVDSHHIIGDGMSTPILLQRLDMAYRKQNAAVEWDFYDYLNTISGKDDALQADIAHWTAHLAQLPEALQLGGDFPRPKKFDYKGTEYQVLLNAEESRACEAFCRDSGYSEYMVFLAAYGMLLSAVSGKKDLIIGTPVAGRNVAGTDQICGPFINTLPLRLQLDDEMTVQQWLEAVRSEVTRMLDHQNVTLETLISALNLPHGAQNPLYQVMMTQSPVDESKFMLNGGKMEYVPISTGSVKMDMIMELTKKDDCFALRFSYATSLFSEQTIAFYGRCIRNAVKALREKGSCKLADVGMLGAADQEMLIDTPNYSTTPFLNRPIHQILQGMTAIKGEETAVIFHGQAMTFAQLEGRANAIAAFIEGQQLQAGQCVALCLKRTPDMIAAMYGALKAGHPYMFMLDSFPEARLRYMLQISGAGILLHDGVVTLPDSFRNGELEIPVCQLPQGSESRSHNANAEDDSLVNVLFTSGSTGQPKGVMLRHRSVSNLYSQMKELLQPIEGNVLCSTNSVFDCFVVETLIALALGRTVVLADEEEMMLPWKLANLVETYDTGVFEMTPARLNMCLGNEAFRAAANHIRIVLLGGEVVTDALVNKFYDCSDGVLMNMYGPTEATVFTTMEPLRRGEHITIGRPLANTRTYVLDENRRPVLPTACGEMYIAGECLSAGYVGRPELTAEAFVEDIYFPGKKMYRSGDLVRLRLDGRYDYVGRKDAQVKLNGQRVELSEITVAIENTAEHMQAATVALKKQDGTMELCAFYVSDSKQLTTEQIYSSIRKTLPTYMVPSRILRLEKMPMTATNKIDRITLQRYAAEGVPVAAECKEAPKTEPKEAPKAPVREKISAADVNADYVLAVWNTVLTTPATSQEDSFFAQGGTSMAALTVLSRYYNDRLEMSLAEFYENPTARQQAQLLKSRSAEKEPAAEEIPQPEAPAAPAEEKSVLLTGATGFFGAHLVKELVDAGCQRILCLMRDGSEQRLADTLQWYFGDLQQKLMERIVVVRGDIAQPKLGMEEASYQNLCRQIGEIYHTAADVRHYAADAEPYLQTNVGGTENMVELAKCAGAKLYHMSTCSVSGEVTKDGRSNVVFTEKDLDVGQVWEKNIYVKSKFYAECAVWEAIKQGLDAKIFRLGRLVGRETDGKFQKNPESNAFYLTMKGFCQVGAIPEEAARGPIDLMPIDLAAKEVLKLTRGDQRAYHIMNAVPPTLGEVMTALDPNIRIVPTQEYYGILSDAWTNLDDTLWAVVADCVRSNATAGKIRVTNSQTTEALQAMGFRQEPVCVDMVLKEFWRGE